jgi:transposase
MSKRSQKQAHKRRKRLLRVKAGNASGPEKSNHSDKPNKTDKPSSTQQTEISISELEAIIKRSATEPLNKQERQTLLEVSQTLQYVTEQLEKKGISIARLKKLLFGASTETLDNLIQDDSESGDKDNKNDDKNQDSEIDLKTKEKPKGHGRNGADAYTGAPKVKVSHETLKPGDSCPNCVKGTVYECKIPGRIVRVTGQAPLTAKVYELQKLRCNLCGKVFTAALPKEAGPDKYNAESISIMALLKYGTGVPFNRLHRLQGNLGIPLSASTQWYTLSKHEYAFVPIYDALIVAAAQGKIVHNDDTAMRVIESATLEKIKIDGKDAPDRKGIFTSGIVSIGDGCRIAMFFTGHKHAGENLADVLKHRASELSAPIQMSDALSRNIPKAFETLVANCLVHGRRNFVDVFENFPSECQYVLELLAKVYKHDAITRQYSLSDDDRLHLHQVESGPVMKELKDWMTAELETKKVEPNSGLGEAMTYMLKHWEKLTLFLRQAGTPLDNNICERALKKAILHRKNAYYYKTAEGARVGDMFMSLIHTCELNKINSFNYLTEIQKHAEAVALSPAHWLPWNHQETLNQSPATGNG